MSESPAGGAEGAAFDQRLALLLSQWWICIGIAAALVLVEELIKVFVRRRARRGVPAGVAKAMAAA